MLWMSANVLILSTTEIMEYGRSGQTLEFWQPLSWEITSVVMVLLQVPVIVLCIDKFINSFGIKGRIAAHLLLTLPFSIIHVAGMVTLRKGWYWLMDMQYQFGDLSYELLYEYRKDIQTYFAIVVVIHSYRFILRRLQGEASIVAEAENGIEPKSQGEELYPERLLVKKLGKEFLIQVQDIEWVEAAGNYANLHIKQSVYPMRITMAKLEKSLPVQKFARIHRSSIVNLNQVDVLIPLDTGDYELTLRNGEKLSLSRRYRERFKGLLNLNDSN